MLFLLSSFGTNMVQTAALPESQFSPHGAFTETALKKTTVTWLVSHSEGFSMKL